MLRNTLDFARGGGVVRHTKQQPASHMFAAMRKFNTAKATFLPSTGVFDCIMICDETCEAG